VAENPRTHKRFSRRCRGRSCSRIDSEPHAAGPRGFAPNAFGANYNNAGLEAASNPPQLWIAADTYPWATRPLAVGGSRKRDEEAGPANKGPRTLTPMTSRNLPPPAVWPARKRSCSRHCASGN